MNWYWNNVIHEYIQQALKNNKGTNYLPQELIQACKIKIEAKSQLLQNCTLSLIHGDLNSDNIIVNSENLIQGIIYWEWASLGNPLYDITNIQQDLFHGHEQSYNEFLVSYGLDLSNTGIITRIYIYKTLQDLQSATIGYWYHNPDEMKFREITNSI